MDKKVLVRLHRRFEDMVRSFPDTNTEFWCARDLQELLGYSNWQNFSTVIEKDITACEKAGYNKKDHFIGINKMVVVGSYYFLNANEVQRLRHHCHTAWMRDTKGLTN